MIPASPAAHSPSNLCPETASMMNLESGFCLCTDWKVVRKGPMRSWSDFSSGDLASVTSIPVTTEFPSGLTLVRQTRTMLTTAPDIVLNAPSPKRGNVIHYLFLKYLLPETPVGAKE